MLSFEEERKLANLQILAEYKHMLECERLEQTRLCLEFSDRKVWKVNTPEDKISKQRVIDIYKIRMKMKALKIKEIETNIYYHKEIYLK